MMNSRAASISLAQQAVDDLTIARVRFNRSTGNLTEAFSGFAPAEGMMTSAQHMQHASSIGFSKEHFARKVST